METQTLLAALIDLHLRIRGSMAGPRLQDGRKELVPMMAIHPV